MATGDQNDVFGRLKIYLPARWFGDVAPIRDALLRGLAYAGAFIYSLYAYAKLQTRIKTATDGWLDMIASDFFGTSIFRASGQTDASFLSRIISNLFRERATRNGLIRVLVDITGRTPKVFEPARPMDTGCYGGPTIGYGLAGGYGSLLLPFQTFVTAYRPLSSGIPYINGYGNPAGGYGQASRAEYASITMIVGSVTDADIYAAADSVKPAASIIWMNISS